jgi:hypothetical protein
MEIAGKLFSLLRELEEDPLGRGYAGMTVQEATDDLNTKYRIHQVQSFSGDFMFQQTDPNEFSVLPAEKQQLWVSFTSRQSVDPWATNNEEFVKWIFGSSSSTVGNLVAAREKYISRAQELGYQSVTAQWVAICRGNG